RSGVCRAVDCAAYREPHADHRRAPCLRHRRDSLGARRVFDSATDSAKTGSSPPDGERLVLSPHPALGLAPHHPLLLGPGRAAPALRPRPRLPRRPRDRGGHVLAGGDPGGCGDEGQTPRLAGVRRHWGTGLARVTLVPSPLPLPAHTEPPPRFRRGNGPRLIP